MTVRFNICGTLNAFIEKHKKRINKKQSERRTFCEIVSSKMSLYLFILILERLE